MIQYTLKWHTRNPDIKTFFIQNTSAIIPSANLPRLKYDGKITTLLTTRILLALHSNLKFIHLKDDDCHRYQSKMYASSFDQCQGWHVYHSRLSHSANVQESNATVAHLFPNSYSFDSCQNMPPPWYLFQNTSQESSHLALRIPRSIRSRDASASDMDWDWHSLQYCDKHIYSLSNFRLNRISGSKVMARWKRRLV